MPRAPRTLPGVRRIVLPSGNVSWEAVCDIGGDGTRRQLRRRFRTREQAEAWRLDKLAERRAGAVTDPGGLTVAALIGRWLALPSPRRSPQTRMLYRTAWERLGAPRWGGVRLDRVRPAALQAWVDDLAESGTPPSSLRHALLCLRGALEQAVAWELLPRNPARSLAPPPVEPVRDVRPPTVAEVRRLLARADDPDAALWRLLAATGLRIGEALVLEWGDLDLDGGVLAVRRHLTGGIDGERLIAEGAKSRAGVRSLALDPATVAALRRHRAAQNGRRLALGEGWKSIDLVFDDGEGDVQRPSTVRRRLARSCVAVGIRTVTPHSLRHHHQTVLDMAGVRGAVSRARLGHASEAMTARYTHGSDEEGRAAADAVAAALDEEAG